MTIDLVPHWQIGAVVLTSYPFGVDADSTVDVGEPAMVVEGVASQIADGDIERVVRHGNRTYVLELYVEGPTLGELAKSEALLRSELNRTGLLLTHDPGDGLSPVSVYEVQTAKLTPHRRDDHESHLVRKFTLTLTCAPFARSADPVTVAGLPTGSSTVSIDACDSATGWTATRNGAPDVASTFWEAGAVGVMELNSATGFPPETWTLTRGATLALAATPYLVVEVTTLTAKSGGPLIVTAHAGATSAGPPLPVMEVRRIADGSGYYRMVFDTSAHASMAGVTFSHVSSDGYGHKWQGLSVRNVAATDIAPNVTARQMTRIVAPEGTERTPVSIHVQAANGTDNLGMAIVHTSPADGSGYSPPLRRWKVTGNTASAAGDTLSGSAEVMNATAFVADIPNSALPAGGYVLMARIKSSAAVTVAFNWQATAWFLPTSESQGIVSGLTLHTFPADGFYQLVPLAVLSLPTVRGAGMTQIALSYTGAFGGTLTLDEAFLFRAGDDCALTIVKDPLPHLWIDSADLNTPVPTVWRGTSSDRGTARHPGASLAAMGAHVLSAGGTAAFTAAVTDYPQTDFTYYDRWHSNAAR